MPGGLEHRRGFVDGYTGECPADAAVFDEHVPQEIANQVAATLAAISADEDAFYARCAFCLRPLRDEISKLVGVGPDCARKHGVPHSMAAASKRLEIRRRILGETDQAQH